MKGGIKPPISKQENEKQSKTKNLKPIILYDNKTKRLQWSSYFFMGENIYGFRYV